MVCACDHTPHMLKFDQTQKDDVLHLDYLLVGQQDYLWRTSAAVLHEQVSLCNSRSCTPYFDLNKVQKWECYLMSKICKDS